MLPAKSLSCLSGYLWLVMMLHDLCCIYVRFWQRRMRMSHATYLWFHITWYTTACSIRAWRFLLLSILFLGFYGCSWFFYLQHACHSSSSCSDFLVCAVLHSCSWLCQYNVYYINLYKRRVSQKVGWRNILWIWTFVCAPF